MNIRLMLNDTSLQALSIFKTMKIVLTEVNDKSLVWLQFGSNNFHGPSPLGICDAEYLGV